MVRILAKVSHRCGARTLALPSRSSAELAALDNGAVRYSDALPSAVIL